MPRDAVTEIDLKRDVVDLAVDLAKMHIRVALAGAVASFERTTSRAWVNLKARFTATNFQPTDEPQAEDLPVIHPAGDGYGFWFDMAEGDPMVVVCCDSAVRGFYESGEAVTPSIGQSHSYGTAVSIPGGRVSSSQPGLATPPPNNAAEAVVGAGDGSASVIFRRAAHPLSPAELGTVVVAAAGPAASVLLGSATAAVPVACATQTAANFSAINTTIQGLPVVPGDPGVIAALKTAFLAYNAALQNVADAKARVDGPAP